MKLNDRLLYKGYYWNNSHDTVHVVEGYPLGIDPVTCKYIFNVVGNGEASALIPDTKILIGADGNPIPADDIGVSTAITIGVIPVDEIRGFSGCTDKNGTRIFHQDFVDVDGRKFFIYFSDMRLRWELLEVGEGFAPGCPPEGSYGDFKPVALYRLKESLAQKATLVPVLIPSASCRPKPNKG